MTNLLSVANVMKDNTNQANTEIKNKPVKMQPIKFKANDNDQFIRNNRQTSPVITRVPIQSQQDMMLRAMEEQKKKERKQKTKNNIMTGIGAAASIIMIAYFGLLLKDRHAAKKAMRQAAEQGGPTSAQRELGIKTKEELLELFTDVSREKSFEDLKMSGTLKKQLEGIMDKIKNAKKYEDAMQELEQMYIFWGPPGTGKTTFINAMCKKFGIKPFKYDMGILKGGYQGTTENNMTNVSKVFLEEHRAARAKDPNHISIMFFDECDEVFLEAVGPNKNSNNEIMSRFKQYLNEWREEPGVLVFCCTNKHPMELNEAIRNRGTQIYIENPIWKALSENFFNHFKDAKPGAIAENLRTPSKKSDEFFKILEAKNGRDFAYRDLQRIGWKTSETIPDGHILSLDDIIQRAINADIGLNQNDINALKELLNKTDDLLAK